MKGMHGWIEKRYAQNNTCAHYSIIEPGFRREDTAGWLMYRDEIRMTLFLRKYDAIVSGGGHFSRDHSCTTQLVWGLQNIDRVRVWAHPGGEQPGGDCAGGH